MYSYTINVSLNGKHLFTTSDRSLTYQEKAKEVYDILKEKFTEAEGYSITVIQWEKHGIEIDFDS